MGKIPPSFKGSQFPKSALLKTPQSPSQTPLLTQKPQHFLKKIPNKRPSKSPPTPHPPPPPPSLTFTTPLLSDAKSVFNSLITTTTNKHAIPSDPRFFNSILQSYSAISSPHDSISLLNYMIKTHPPFCPNQSTFHIILSQSCKSSDPTLSLVHQALNLMASHGFPPDKIAADIAVRSLCSADCPEHAIELIKELSLKNCSPDKYTYNFLTKYLCKNRTVSAVNGFIRDMKEFCNIKPDLVTYTIMIDNVCNGKNLREATRLLGVLAEEGFKPDCYVYNTIMKGGRSGAGLPTYNTLIYGLSKAGRVKQAKSFLNVMAEMGHFPDAVTYTSLMNGMCREGNAVGAMTLLEEMEAKGCSPNSCTYNTLLHGLSKGRLLEKAIELFGVMKAGGMELETGSYGTFLRALCKKGKVAEAYEAFDYAVESKSLTEVAAYTTLETTLKWLQKAKEQGLVTIFRSKILFAIDVVNICSFCALALVEGGNVGRRGRRQYAGVAWGRLGKSLKRAERSERTSKLLNEELKKSFNLGPDDSSKWRIIAVARYGGLVGGVEV
ncbi:hypothetical protein RJ639_005202 [Escallonia herrerae]|uniref:Pentatricopeptide repeat-containing protein n=1 Tax=Escallonia herrerae TaxID=1293975 RepID=A0AA89AX67_9ASTE|nr:hypothetical protein RJ639_005202 [Escallonia herrerae]